MSQHGQNYRTRQAGFTLVEALVTTVLSVIGSGIILTVLWLTVRESGESAGNMQMERVYDLVSGEIGKNVRMGRAVLPGSTPFANRNKTAAFYGDTLIRVYDANGFNFATFKIDDGVLYESDSLPFTVGPDTVRVVAGSGFDVHAGGKGIDLDLSLQLIEGGETYTLDRRRDSFRCRDIL